MNIIEKKEYPLLSRTEIIAKESYTGATPSRDTIKKILAEKLNAKNELIVIKHIYPEFGFGNAKIIAYLYSNKKDMERIEPEYAFKKGIPREKKEEKKAEDKKKPEEKTEEKPAEQEKQDKGKPEEKKPEQEQEGKKEELKKPEQKEEIKPEQEQQENKDTKESKPEQKENKQKNQE